MAPVLVPERYTAIEALADAERRRLCPYLVHKVEFLLDAPEGLREALRPIMRLTQTERDQLEVRLLERARGLPEWFRIEYAGKHAALAERGHYAITRYTLAIDENTADRLLDAGVTVRVKQRDDGTTYHYLRDELIACWPEVTPAAWEAKLSVDVKLREALEQGSSKRRRSRSRSAGSCRCVRSTRSATATPTSRARARAITRGAGSRSSRRATRAHTIVDAARRLVGYQRMSIKLTLVARAALSELIDNFNRRIADAGTSAKERAFLEQMLDNLRRRGIDVDAREN